MGKPEQRKAITSPKVVAPAPDGNPWISKTPQQRCALIRNHWTPGASMQNIADRITLAIEWKVTKAMVLSHSKNYRQQFLSDIEFSGDNGYRDLYLTMAGVEPGDLLPPEYFSALCHSVGVTDDFVRGDGKGREAMQMRQVAAYLLKKNFPDITHYKIGQIINRDSSTAKTSVGRVSRQVRIWGRRYD
jgi:hypothetical protein